MANPKHKPSHDEAKNFAQYFGMMIKEEANIQNLEGITSMWEHSGTTSEKFIRMTVVIPYVD